MFKEQTFTTMQWCDMCGSCLWGLHRQGVLCSECGYQCHRKCSFDTVVVCPRRRVRVRRESDADGKIRPHIHLLNWFMCQYWTDRKAGRQAGRQASRQTDRQTDKQTNRQTDRQTNRQTDRQTGRKTDRQTDGQKERQKERQTDRKTDRQTDRQKDRQKDRQTDRQTGRQAGRQTDRQPVEGKYEQWAKCPLVLYVKSSNKGFIIPPFLHFLVFWLLVF